MDSDHRIVKRLIPHVFLPLKLPGATSESLISEENHLLLMLQQIIEQHKHIAQIDETCNAFKSWVRVQVQDCEIKAQIKSLKPGQLFALYVRAQNCGLLVSVPKQYPDEIIWSTFPASQKNKVVTGSPGVLQVSFPATSIEVKRRNFMNSDAFLKQLNVLMSAELRDAKARSKKADTEVVEVRDVNDTIFISAWLPTLLVTQDSQRLFGDIPIITKKIRDNVVFEDALLPFRRSGMWTTLKVVLNISLVRDLGDVRGLFMYKMVILRLLLTFLEPPVLPVTESTGIEMLKKVGRRLRKLEMMNQRIRDTNKENLDLTDMYDSLVDDGTKIIKSAREQVDRQWNHIIDTAMKTSTVNLNGADFKISQSLIGNGLGEFLSASVNMNTQKTTVSVPHVPPRHRLTVRKKYVHTIPDATSSTFCTDTSIKLFDFERNVLHNWSEVITVDDHEYVWNTFHKYTNSALVYYSHDPVGMSRSILTMLKMIQVWDKLVCVQYPLLHSYKIGIDAAFVGMLLVPSKEELAIVDCVSDYFAARQQAPNSSLLEEKPNTSSFSVQFAEQSPDMERLRVDILDEGQRDVDDKMREVEVARSHCQSLRDEIAKMRHEYSTDGIDPSHLQSCYRCRLTQIEQSQRIKIHEKPLPEDIYRQRAVVFELLIPSAIACLRDLIYTFSTRVVASIGESKAGLHGMWSDQLKPHTQRLLNWKVNLGSGVKSFLQSHYQSLHPNQPIEKFTVNNGYNTCYGVEGPDRPGISLLVNSGANVKKHCTLKVESGSKYDDMQWAIDGNVVTPNEVLARQSQCHRNMSTSEFIEFGSMRCYNKLQIRNLIRAIVPSKISLENESVFNLTCQLLWECSPRNETGMHEAHADYLDATFMKECLAIMDDLVEKHKDNWQKHYIVFVAIVFAVNLAEKCVDRSTLEMAGTLVLKCRDVTGTWSRCIQEIASKIADANPEQKNELTMKLVEVNVCRAISFSAHTQLRTMATPEHIQQWLLTVTIVNYHIAFIQNNASNQMLWLVRRVCELGVHIEECVVGLPEFHQGVNMFLRSHYGGAEDLNFSDDTVWERYEGSEQIYFMEAKKKQCTDEIVTVQVDIVAGLFLVNGCKVCSLPDVIANHVDYVRAFPTISFEVQPLGPNKAVTKYQYNGSRYTFALNEGTLIVTEIVVGTPIRRTLIPSEYLPDNFPHQFEHGYTHWWDADSETVNFFPRNDKEPLKLLATTKPELLLQINDGRKLEHVESKRFLADIGCPTVQNLSKVLSRLESSAHIHVWFDSNEDNYTVDLPRMRLSFVVRAVDSISGIAIMSQEYDGMKIAEQQQIKTLVGLQQGLLLTNGVEKMLLVPHGEVHLNDHHSVTIRTDDVFEPPYFRYDVDERLGQLKAGETQTGWFYLAYLHAITSGFIPDPFTRVTGTERAFQILNSGVCFPSQPFSPATLKIIHLLRDVAPTRKYYPNNESMETVRWPLYISPLAAHDNFVAVTDDLILKSNRIVFLFVDREEIAVDDRDIDLMQKATLRRSCISNGINGAEALPYTVVKPPPESFSCRTEGIARAVQISRLCDSNLAELPISSDVFECLRKALLNNKSLPAGFDKRNVCSETISDWMSINFSKSWLGIYEAAREVKRKNQTNEWNLFLSYLAFRRDKRIDMRQLCILNAIAVHHERFADINPPEYDSYSCTSEYGYNEKKVETALTSHVNISLKDFAESCKHKRRAYESWRDFVERMRPSYEADRDPELQTLKAVIKNQWPRSMIGSSISGRPVAKYFNWPHARDDVNSLFTRWYKNRELRSFLSQVATTVESCAICVSEPNALKLVSAISPIPPDNAEEQTPIDSPLHVRLNDFVCNNFGDGNFLASCDRLFCGNFGNNDSVAVTASFPLEDLPSFPLEESRESPICNEFVNDLRTSWNEWQKQKDFSDAEAVYPLEDTNKFTSTSIWNHISDSIQMNSKIYFLSDWCPRVAPTTLLPLVCNSFEKDTAMDNLRTLLGGYAVTIAREQQQCRIEKYKRQGSELNMLELKRESSNIGHTNWSPKDRPAWLLFEIENDLLIRPLQIKVADQMEHPVDESNSLMQMNMGEGKTSVIIPLLSLSLANGVHLCRITVLRSLYQINLKSLSLKIGGLLLNRRVYTMPCRRDYEIAEEQVNEMMNAYRECLEAKGVLLTLPEHRLSFALKKHEKALAGDDKVSMAIDCGLKWLQSNVRDVLDESDEILQVKYQLVYTLGEPLTIDAGSARWTIAQKILRLVPDRIESLLQSERLAKEFELKRATSSQEFSYCRVLSDFAYQELCNGLYEGAIEAGLIPEPPPALREIVVKFLTQEIVSASDMRTLESACFYQATNKDNLLILRGLLACGVLRLCLSKRWRVNYGVNPIGHRKMAVPFRAKDVAAERAEFGHPDVAIVFTVLSYYYSGLSDQQLEDTFSGLFQLNFAEEEYQSWMALLPRATAPNLTSIRKLSGVNLSDFRQKYEVLFPALRKNMATINFWLGQAVFPAESKQFDLKVGCSAWDLCREDTTYPTTGFSGTNDTKLLLPQTIQQRDLPELVGTNGKVLENLLRPENDHYEGLERHISAKEIIQKLVDGDIKVLLDVGAIMLELNNEEVANEWLKQCPSIEAVVFFDSKDHLVVKHRSACRATPFELSPWRNRLDRCAIYLDEIHTRGTDLKIPLDTTAVVTLGKGVRKDTLAQGCMRMRKLGQGHAIRFWGSSEVHAQMLKFAENGTPPGACAVLKWAIQNSVNYMEDGFIHLAESGIYDLQKRSAEMICNVNEEPKLLAQLCSRREILDLTSMYGLQRSVLKYPCIAQNMIDNMLARLRSLCVDHNFREHEIRQNSESMLRHLDKYVGQLVRTSNVLDEEQEREFELEPEKETEIEPPPQATAEKHIFNPRLRTFIIGNQFLFHPSDLLPLKDAFVSSNLQKYCNTATSWGIGPEYKVLATQDFERTVIQSSLEKSNDFLRPVMWIYHTVSEAMNIAIMLSPSRVKIFFEFRCLKSSPVLIWE